MPQVKHYQTRSQSKADQPSTSKSDEDRSEAKTPEHADPTTRTPEPKRAESPQNCSICLSGVENKAFTDSCLHTFCYVCLLEWSKVKAVCPLCKQPFKKIIYNVRSLDDFDEYVIPPPQPQRDHLWENFNASNYRTRFTYRTTMTNDRPVVYHRRRHPAGQYERSLGAPLSRPVGREETRRRRERQALQNRKRVYDYDLWVQPVSPTSLTERDYDCRYRETSPGFFAENEACRYALIPWLSRELNILLNGHEDNVHFVMELILDLIQRFEIRSEEFYELVHPLVGRHTRHFIHEFYHFARNPYDMHTYDQRATYHNRTEPADDNDSDDDDVMVVGEDRGSLSDILSRNSGVPLSHIGPINVEWNISSSLSDVRDFLQQAMGSAIEFGDLSSGAAQMARIHSHHNYADRRDRSGASSVSREPAEPAVGAQTSEHAVNVDDSDDDVIFVKYEKPYAERSPIVLSSGSDDEAAEREASVCDREPRRRTSTSRTKRRRHRGEDRSRPRREQRSRSSVSDHRRRDDRRRTESRRRSFDRRSRSHDRCSRSRDRCSRSRDRCSRSRDRCSRSRDRCSRSRDRCSRSRDRCSRSRDRCSRSRDRRSGSRDRRSRSRDRRSRSRERRSGSRDRSRRKRASNVQSVSRDRRTTSDKAERKRRSRSRNASRSRDRHRRDSSSRRRHSSSDSVEIVRVKRRKAKKHKRDKKHKKHHKRRRLSSDVEHDAREEPGTSAETRRYKKHPTGHKTSTRKLVGEGRRVLSSVVVVPAAAAAAAASEPVVSSGFEDGDLSGESPIEVVAEGDMRGVLIVGENPADTVRSILDDLISSAVGCVDKASRTTANQPMNVVTNFAVIDKTTSSHHSRSLVKSNDFSESARLPSIFDELMASNGLSRAVGSSPLVPVALEYDSDCIMNADDDVVFEGECRCRARQKCAKCLHSSDSSSGDDSDSDTRSAASSVPERSSQESDDESPSLPRISSFVAIGSLMLNDANCSTSAAGNHGDGRRDDRRSAAPVEIVSDDEEDGFVGMIIDVENAIAEELDVETLPASDVDDDSNFSFVNTTNPTRSVIGKDISSKTSSDREHVTVNTLGTDSDSGSSIDVEKIELDSTKHELPILSNPSLSDSPKVYTEVQTCVGTSSPCEEIDVLSEFPVTNVGNELPDSRLGAEGLKSPVPGSPVFDFDIHSSAERFSPACPPFLSMETESETSASLIL